MSFYTHKRKRRCCDTTIHLTWWAFRGFSVKIVHPPDVQTIKPRKLTQVNLLVFLFGFFCAPLPPKLDYAVRPQLLN